MEQNNFTIFEPGPNERTRNRIHVTLSERGRIYINPVAYQALGEPMGLVLMFDEQKQLIGLMPATMTRREVYRVRKLHASNGRYVTALNFCRHFGINLSETLAFQNPSLNHDGVLILSLHHVQPVTRLWAKSKKN